MIYYNMSMTLGLGKEVWQNIEVESNQRTYHNATLYCFEHR